MLTHSLPNKISEIELYKICNKCQTSTKKLVMGPESAIWTATRFFGTGTQQTHNYK